MAYKFICPLCISFHTAQQKIYRTKKKWKMQAKVMEMRSFIVTLFSQKQLKFHINPIKVILWWKGLTELVPYKFEREVSLEVSKEVLIEREPNRESRDFIKWLTKEFQVRYWAINKQTKFHIKEGTKKNVQPRKDLSTDACDPDPAAENAFKVTRIRIFPCHTSQDCCWEADPGLVFLSGSQIHMQ